MIESFGTGAATRAAWDTLQAVGNHLWQTTLVAAGAALLAAALRRARAHVRYALWTAVSVKFLIPFTLLTAIGGQVAVGPSLAVDPPTPAIAAATLVAQPFSFAGAGARRGADPSFAGPVMDRRAGAPALLAAVWLLGAGGIVCGWLIRWQHVRRTRHDGTALVAGRTVDILRRLERSEGLQRSIPLIATAGCVEPGVVGVWRPAILWPADLTARLDDAEIEAVLAHELLHARRHDNLIAAAHMAVQCLFWFHPLVWWLGTRLVDLREQSCDEQVIQAGREPSVYAAGILKTCRFCLESPLACVAGATSSNLAARIDAIMRAAAPDHVRPWQRALIGVAAAALVAGPVLVGILRPAPLQAQAHPAAPPRLSTSGSRQVRMAFLQDAAAAGGQTFEVASVKPNTSGDVRVMFGMRPGGRFTATNVPLRELIRMAYGLQNVQVQGGPDWIGSERFDVVAKAEGDLPPMAPGGTPNPLLLMVQSLLSERFKLAVHRETREMPIYALVMARSDKRPGPQLRQSESDCAALMAARRGAAGGPPPPPPLKPGERPQCGMFMGMARIAAGGVPTTQLAMSLSQRVGRIVVDRTGLSGMYDFEVDFTPDQLPQGPPPPGAPPLPPIDPNGPSLFTALQEQLGLKLDPERGPVEVLFIDSVERPTPD
jgi:uncharacterized protein (TIGR03435 family)